MKGNKMDIPDLLARADVRRLKDALVKRNDDLAAMRCLCCALLLKLGGEVEITGPQILMTQGMDLRFLPGKAATTDPVAPEIPARVALIPAPRTESFELPVAEEKGN